MGILRYDGADKTKHFQRLKKNNSNCKMISAYLNVKNTMVSFIFFVSFVLFPTLSSATPWRTDDICGQVRCKASSSSPKDLKFQYKQGGVYNYLYTVNGTVYVADGTAQQSSLHFSINTTIHFLTPCEAVLFMKDVELWQSVLSSGQDDSQKHHFTKAHTSQTFKESLEQFPLRFSFADGIIEEICPNPVESGWVLNIKRGFLSAFQNTMRRLDLEDKSLENDVNGQCEVKYRIGEATSSTLTIEKIKNLNSCGDKYGIYSAIQGAPYNFGPLQQSMPAVESLSECSQVVDRNLIVEVDCMEKHRLKPLSNGISGVYTSINQHLDLITVFTPSNETEETGSLDKEGAEDDGFGLDMDDEDEEDEGKRKGSLENDVENTGTFFIISKPYFYFEQLIGMSPSQISRRETLLFHHEYHVASINSDYNSASNALKRFCHAAKTNVDMKAGALFETLVSILRGLNLSDMMHLSREASALCGGDRSQFDNVLEAVGSAASVGVIKEKISSGDAPREVIFSWINSLTFIPKPDLDLMAAAFPILRSRDNYPNILLSYSSLAHSFCRQNTTCLNYQPVLVLTKLYEKFFLPGCVTKQRKNVDQTLMHLKGIGNLGMFTDGINNALQTCITTNENSEIRVAAIEAYRRMSCHEVADGHNELRKIFENQHEDAEVRIASFLAIMKCASYPTVRWLRHVMANEQIRQVTSFVSSYVKNLQESSLPSKLQLQGLLTDETFTNPHGTDFRQFSKNFEVSAFYPDGNFGAALDSNLIFSQQSYIPRSTSLNLTVDLFGESINVMEATVRLESFEHYFESIFGPNGKLSNTGIHKLLSMLRREKRAVPSKRKMRTLTLGYDAMRRYYSDPIVSLSMKTLGNEIEFSRLVGSDEQLDALNKWNPFRFIEKLSNTKDSNWQKSTLLFDSSYIIPTGVGLPLNLSAQASSIMRFQAESMIDAVNFRANPIQLKLKGKLVPSALVTASAAVSLTAFKIHAGIKLRAQLRSSTALEGSFALCGTQLFDVEFGVPKEKQELVQFRSDILFQDKGDYKLVDHALPKLKTNCNTGLLYKYMGVKFCTTTQFAPPPSSLRSGDNELHEPPTLASMTPILLNGPSYFSLTLDKSNPNLLKTRFHYQWNNNETHTDLKLRTVKTTKLGSNEKEEELGIQYVLAKAEQAASLDINLPKSRIDATGHLRNDDSIFKIKVTDKGTGNEYLGGLLSLDRIPSTDEASNQTLAKPKSYRGTGNVFYKTWRMGLNMQAAFNSSHLSVDCKGSYNAGGATGSSLQTLQLQISSTNQEQRRHGHLLGTTTNTKIAVDFSQFAEYNTIFLWKSLISEDGYQNDIDFRQGRNYLTDSDPTTFRIQGTAHHNTNYERAGVKWMFLASQPSRQTDWGVEASFNSHGKSFDSAISFRYAPGKSYGTSISVKRKPGVMLFVDAGWNLTIPSSLPMQTVFRLDEHSPRVYQAQYKMDWFGSNNLALDIELSDRSRRNKVDTTCTFTVTTKTIDNFKLGFHYLSEEKESKLQLNSEYQNQRNAFEAGHILNGANKHKIYGSVTVGEVVYLIMTELDFEHGIQCSFLTDLGQDFSDIQVRIKVTNQNGLRQLSFDYSWDVSRDSSKQFQFDVLLDSKQYSHRFEGVVSYPGYNYFCQVHHRYNADDRSRVVMGRLKWKDEEHLHVNAQLVPRISDHEAYDVLLEVATPFELVKNVSFNTGIAFPNGREHCLITVIGSWGDKETFEAALEAHLRSLEDDQGSNRALYFEIPFTISLQGNASTSIENFNSFKVNLQHAQYTWLNSKTDLDIQLPMGKEISLTNHIILPESFSDILSTRIELHIKTPFSGWQNMDVQAVLGRKEDKDVMAVFGIYIESFQYSLVVTGTPRFEEDGALGFEVTTSNPKYDKIFGSFSYVIGDNSRLACQLGWPQVVIGVEAGVESSGWEEFQVYLTFTSPWMPVKNINALAKIDMAQFVEIKLELNEDGVNAKCEWVIESWTSFHISLDGSTPFTSATTFGAILKNSWNDAPAAYSSQIGGWIEDHQIGYKLEGGTSEKEEDCGFSSQRFAQIEINTYVYPTVRATFSLSRIEIKYNLAMSILLREGPINVIAEAEVSDVLRFNEKIRITTPYPGLFELEINLNPALVLESDVYNVAIHSKWRSEAEWSEAGMVLRLGPQDIYAKIAQDDMDNLAFLMCDDEGDEESLGDEYNNVEDANNKIDAQSQLFHFYSPLKWASVVKFEYQKVSGSPDSDNDGGSLALDQNSQDDLDQFPFRNVVVIYQGSNASFTTILQNEDAIRTFKFHVDVPTSTDRLAFGVDCSLDVTEAERKFNVQALSRHPTLEEYSVTSLWNNQLPQYFSGNIEVNTPIEKLEQQSASIMYAHNEGESSYTADLEFGSITDKFATTVVLRPRHFSMTLNTPFESHKEIEIRADSKDNEESPNDAVDTVIVIKNGEIEIELDVVSHLEDNWPSKIAGSVLATLPPSNHHGTLSSTVSKNGNYEIDGNGEILLSNNQKLSANFYFNFPVAQGRLEEFRVEANTTNDGGQYWNMKIIITNEATNGIEYSVSGVTPYQPFSMINGDLLLKKEDNWFEVDTLQINGKSPNLTIAVDSSWYLEKWNDFEFSVKAKYKADINQNLKTIYEFMQSIPDANGIRINLGNKIPSFGHLSSVDSKAAFYIQEPETKIGQQIRLHYAPEEFPAFSLLSSTTLMEDSTQISADASFDRLFKYFDGTANYKSSGSTDRLCNVNCKWTRDEESVAAETELVWGSETLGTVSITGVLNGSVSSDGMLSIHIGSPKESVAQVEQQGSHEENELDSQEQAETQNPDANSLVNPMITIDGTFNKISGRHTARVQIGQSGVEKPPITAQVKVDYNELNDFSTTVNFTSGIENYTDVGLHACHTFHGNSISGNYGGHWDGEEAAILYDAEYESTVDVFFINVSLFGVVPVSTESVPRPQRVGVDVLYKSETENTETAFRGEYNGVQLLKTNYKSGSMSGAGIEKRNTQLEIDNHFWPYGINHSYHYDYSGGHDRTNLPAKVAYFFDIYRLNTLEEQKIEGELRMETNFTGERIVFECKHPERNVQLITDYNLEDDTFQHGADLSWKEGSWLGYQIVMQNRSQEKETDHGMYLKLHYPLRTIHLDTDYTLNENELAWTTAVNLNASRTDNKLTSRVVAGMEPEENKGRITISIKHPTLAHDIIAAGELAMAGMTLSSSSPGRIDGLFSLKYSDDPTQELVLNWDAKLDFHEIFYGLSGISSITTSLPYWELETKAELQHSATNLDLKTFYSTQHSQHELSIITLMDFKNGVKNANQESKMAFELLKESKEASLQLSDPEGYALLWGQLSGQFPEFFVNGKCNVTGIFPSPTANISVDLEKPFFKMYAVHGKDLHDGIFGEGGVVDSRNVFFDISESYSGYRYSDVNFYLRLNNSRLITSKLKWRPELFNEITDLCTSVYKKSNDFIGAKWNNVCKTLTEDATQSFSDIWTLAKPNVEGFLEEMKKDMNFTTDVDALQTVLVTMYNENEFHLLDLHNCVQLVVEEVSARIKAAFERYKRELENPGQLLGKAMAWVVQQFKDMYENLKAAWKNCISSGTSGIQTTLEKIKELFFLYINDGIEMAEKLITQIYTSVSNFVIKIYSHISLLVKRYQSSIMGYVHHLEATAYDIVAKILDFFYETKDAIVRSPYYERLTKLVEDLDEMYKDFQRNTLEDNLKKYYTIAKGFAIRKVSELKNINFSLGKMGEKLETLIKNLLETELVKDLKEALEDAVEKTVALVRFTEMERYLRNIAVMLISKGKSIFFMSATNIAASFEQAKTKFYFHPGKGIVSLEQKLPMPLAAFNETPNFKELPEYRFVIQAQNLFQSSDDSYWKLYKILSNPANLIPPFDGHAMVFSPAYFVTFDGVVYKRKGHCSHLLAADLVDGNFSVSLQYEHSSGNEEGTNVYNVIVSSGHNTLIIDLIENNIKDAKKGVAVSLPVQMANLEGYQFAETLNVHSPKGLIVSCSTVYQTCQIKISGWYSRKISGVLGTMDLEPFTDLITPDGKVSNNLTAIFSSWDVSDDSATESCTDQAALEDEAEIFKNSADIQIPVHSKLSWCHRVFSSTQSSLQSCFSSVDVSPFLDICVTAAYQNNNTSTSPSPDECKAAVAYVHQCEFHGVLVKTPTGCIRCDMNGETMTDRDMKVISSPPAGSPSVSSTDIVFIIEAKDCNRILRTKRKSEMIVAALEEEFEKKGFKNNRYAAVVYGGDGVYERPRSVIQNTEIFTSPTNIGEHVSSISFGNGKSDAFEAIWFTLQNLDFRPGVSKTFILFPCTSCNPRNMKKDFSTVHYAMLEQDAKLHILMKHEFLFDSKKLSKRFFGYDANLGFTKSDGIKDRLKGDSKILQDVFLPKKILGYCAPLALETNGTIFSAKKLQNKREKVVKLFTTVFSRRVVMTAVPSTCQTCYCLPKDGIGIGKIQCFVCDYPRYKPPPDDYEELVQSVDDEDNQEIYDDEDDE